MRAIVVVLYSLMWCMISYGQPIRARIVDAPHILKQHNTLQFLGNNTIHDYFFGLMRDLALYGKGKIRVLHMGGSHIQADIYSNRMRNHLSNFLPNLMSSRGLIFPFTTAKTNNPRNYKVSNTGAWSATRNVDRTLSNPLGLSGISVSTKDSAATLSIHFDVAGETPHDFRTLKVLHNTDSLSYQVKWLGADSAEIERRDGYTLISFNKNQKRIDLGFEKSDSLQTSFLLYGLVLDSDYSGFSYSAVGVNGASTWSYLKCELFSAHLEHLPPDIVFFGIGINDAHDANFSEKNYFNNYEKIMKNILSVNPNALFVFITNNDSYGTNKRLNTNAPLVQKVMFDLAKKYNGAVWDCFSVMGGLKSSNQWLSAGLMAKDRIHFTTEGYTLIGDLLFNALMDSFDNYLEKVSQNQ